MRPALFFGNNPISLAGGAITTAAGVTMIAYWLVELFGRANDNPYLGIILPSLQPIKVKIPLMDITSAKAGKDDKFGKPGIFNFSMTSITPSIWKGERSAINIEYTSTGRKYIVELGSFLRGNDEVQMWKNYLTCTQAEADTSTKPFGEWKSLPKEKTIKRKEENEDSKSED